MRVILEVDRYGPGDCPAGIERITWDLAEDGVRTSERRVRRLARANGLKCVHPGPSARTTIRDSAARAGLDPSLLPALAERQIAALGGDGNNDTAASTVAGVDFPVHVLAVNALGLHLLDYLELTKLAATCAEIRRWSFLCVIAPLRLPTGTGSPVNPIAVL